MPPDAMKISRLQRREGRKLKWYGHVYRSSGILQGTVRAARRRGRQRKRRADNVREWIGQDWTVQSHGGLWKTDRRSRLLVVRSAVVPIGRRGI